MNEETAVQHYSSELDDIFSKNRAVVFLCGPSLKDMTKPGAKLREKIEEALKSEGFEVVIGEDDGLEQLRNKYSTYAHENELLFIQNYCHAVILIASSVGAYCELGLFSYNKVHDENNKTDFILIISDEYEKSPSYLNEGPAKAMDDFGKVYYVDLDHFDFTEIIERLKRRRSVIITKSKKRKL
jgi:hypothetical protein